LVDKLLGTYEPAEIDAKLNERFGMDRTACAVIQRLKRRGVSRWMEGYSLRDLERIFGVDHQTIVRRWIEPGLLIGRRWSGRGPHKGWFFAPQTVEAFVRAHVYAIDCARMPPGHPLTQVATMETRRQRWSSVSDLARDYGLATSTVR
jgi:hypothetical protein